MPRPIVFYFDFISPYAWLAWTQVHAIAAKHGRDVEAVPILFAALLDTYGHKGPAEIPPKRTYLFKDVLRTSHVLGVHTRPPPAHPFNPLLALRCASLAGDAASPERKRAVDALYAETWGGGRGVTDPTVVVDALTKAGLDGADLVARAASNEAKALVRAQTERALADGAFGVPTMMVDGELFWGVDSLGHVERRLQGHDPADGVDFAQWRDLPAQAVRKAAR